MMGLDDRLFYMFLGGVIGFVFGYIVRVLREIKGEIEKEEELLKKFTREEGIMRLPNWRSIRKIKPKDLALFLVICLTAYAAFASQINSNHIKKGDERDRQVQQAISKVTFCNQRFLSKTIIALNQRTTYSKKQALANIELQKSFLTFLTIITVQPTKSEAEQKKAFDVYLVALNRFVNLSNKSADNLAENPYPTVVEYRLCLSQTLDPIRKGTPNV